MRPRRCRDWAGYQFGGHMHLGTSQNVDRMRERAAAGVTTGSPGLSWGTAGGARCGRAGSWQRVIGLDGGQVWITARDNADATAWLNRHRIAEVAAMALVQRMEDDGID